MRHRQEWDIARASCQDTLVAILPAAYEARCDFNEDVVNGEEFDWSQVI